MSASINDEFCGGSASLTPDSGSGFEVVTCDGPSGLPAAFYVCNSAQAADVAISGMDCRTDINYVRGPSWVAMVPNPDDAAALISAGASELNCG